MTHPITAHDHDPDAQQWLPIPYMLRIGMPFRECAYCGSVCLEDLIEADIPPILVTEEGPTTIFTWDYEKTDPWNLGGGIPSRLTFRIALPYRGQYVLRQFYFDPIHIIDGGVPDAELFNERFAFLGWRVIPADGERRFMIHNLGPEYTGE